MHDCTNMVMYILVITVHIQEFGDGPIPVEVDNDAVIVPNTPNPCRESDLPSIAAVCSLPHVLSSDCHVVDVYLEALNYIRSHNIMP